MNFVIRLLAVFTLATGCKPYQVNQTAADLKSDDAPDAEREPARDLATGRPVADESAAFREFEAIDCPREICNGSVDLVEATPEGANQMIASTFGDRRFGGAETAYALAGPGSSASFEDVSAAASSLNQTFASGGIDGLRAFSAMVAIGNALSQLEGKTPREKVQSAKEILAALKELDRSQSAELRQTLLKHREGLLRLKPLQALAAQLGNDPNEEQIKKFQKAAAAAFAFFRDNLVADGDEAKLSILEALLDAIPAELLDAQGDGKSSMARLNDPKAQALLAAAKRFAGQDGFVNRGDTVRILPVVPKLVEEVADEKIQEGFAQGMAQLASEHPFVYRRWMRRPNGLIGRAVNNGISQAMSQANQAKWQAVREVGAATQKMYDDLMSDLGVQRYYLNLETDGNFYDPEAELSTGEIRSLFYSLTGMTVGDIANKMRTFVVGGK